ncbi:helix-turn-helix domain-containing protein [Streptomyces sp. NBC_00140]|uniref:helix-turn-helix domain-containing protein n=1 Tax=Streptomyces sp. NBC_00140 TaxID=2975664 RepID=UPI0022506712|nr:helix-turn-helix domain-containing protein [Streptomyces sp. NBC_00140]MCX5338107.1 helix-turn-helix domain-containing protein [Streptomyces sp. NBC_00140]
MGSLADKIEKYLTTEEVARRYRTVPGTVRYWRHIGYIPEGVKRGRRVLYDPDVLDRWDAEQQAGGAAA